MNERVAPHRGSHTADVDAELAALGEERDFLLSSLRDLEAEHDAQDIDDVDYETLRDDYTARTAVVLRAIERAKQPVSRAGRGRAGGATASSETVRGGMARGTPTGPRPPRRPALGAVAEVTGSSVDDGLLEGGGLDDGGCEEGSGLEEGHDEDLPAAAAVAAAGQRAKAAGKTKTRWRLIAIVTTVLLFGVIAGWAVTATSGSRVSGQSITGNANLRSPTPAPSPSAVDSNLAKAATLVTNGKIGDALKLYDQILKTTPNQPEAEANSGWLIAQTGLAVTPTRTDLVDEGLTRIVAAEKAAPTYADPHFFRGFLLLNAKNDPSDAVTELRMYLGTVDPSSPEVPQVETVLKQAIAAAGPNVPPGPNAPKASEAPSTAATHRKSTRLNSRH